MSTPVNGPLNAAIAALNAQPYPWFAPAYSIRLTDFAVYTSLVTTYGFGTNIIMGLSPNDAAILTGVPIVTNPSYASQMVRPEIFVHPDALNVLGVPITLAESGGTIAISYASPFGRFPQVVWTWQCEVTFDPAVQTAQGAWDQQVVTWAGDGTTGRLIATTFPLNIGVVAIWVFPQSSTARLASFRHSAMAGTTGSCSPARTDSGIMAFTSAGFTVTDNLAQGVSVNEVGQSYTAIVFRDTTTDQRYLHVGSYHGWGHINTAGTFVFGSNLVTCGSFNVWDAGRSYTAPLAGPSYIASVPDGSHFVAGYPSGSTYAGVDTIDVPGGNRPLADGAASRTQLWIFGRATGACAFCSDDFAAPNSTPFALEAKALTDEIIALNVPTSPDHFEIGTDNNVNDESLEYYFVAFTIPVGDPIRSLFATYKVTGAGAPLPVALPFAPAFVTARPFVAGVPVSVWRGPLHAGTASANFDGSANAAGGITAIGAGSFTLAAAVAAAATDVYGFALAVSGSTPNAEPGPPYNPDPPPGYLPSGGLISQGLGTGQLGPCGCPLETP